MRNILFQAVVCAGSLFCGCVNSCAQGQEHVPAQKTDVFSPLSVDQLARLYPRPDAYLGEALQPGEIEAVAKLIATLAGNIQNNYAAGSAKRDAHPKAHGCVDATLDITKDLSPGLAAGLFLPDASYKAVVRFSNGSPGATSSDAKGDTRGMAIKIFGVKGPKLLNDPFNPEIQDIILISSPYFFIDSAENYTKFFEAVDSGNVWRLALIPRYLGIKGSWQAFKMLRQTIANPLETRYWSVVPYQLGLGDARQAVKYSAMPIDPTVSSIPNDPDPNYLRAAMARTLATGPFRMEFMVQRKAQADLSIENSVDEWPESTAPFERVGVLTIHKQVFNTPERDAYCENQSYNPWHSLEAHKPLGMISRARSVVYKAISDLRHGMNNTKIPIGLPDEAR